jgi:hypothetical protein
MGFEDAQAAMDSATTSSETAGTTDSAPESTADKSTAEIIDLASLSKFRFKDRELTPKDLEQSFLKDSDYRRKTQELAKEREQISSLREEQKFHDNLQADLRAMIKDPSLVAQFLEIYPKKFHQYLDLLPRNTLQQAQGQQQQPQVDTKLLRELHDLKTRVLSREQKEEAMNFQNESRMKESQLDAADAKFSQKYKWADPEVVFSKLDYLNNKGQLGNPSSKGYMENVIKIYESIWKQDHEKHLGRFDLWRKEQNREQKRVNAQGKDMASGGGTPSSAPTKLKLKDVKNHILSNM